MTTSDLAKLIGVDPAVLVHAFRSDYGKLFIRIVENLAHKEKERYISLRPSAESTGVLIAAYERMGTLYNLLDILKGIGEIYE